MAVTLGAALGAALVSGAGCGGTLEGRYRRGEIGPGRSTTTTRPRAGAPAGGAAGTDAGVQGAPADASVRGAPADAGVRGAPADASVPAVPAEEPAP